MTWMIIRLVFSLAFIAAVLAFASRLAKKRGLGAGNGLIEVVARDEQVTLLAEVEEEEVQTALAASPRAVALAAAAAPDGSTPAPRTASAARGSSGPLAGSVLDRRAWTSFVTELRERTVRR
jgi:flagellar protein FliO/FliZ